MRQAERPGVPVRVTGRDAFATTAGVAAKARLVLLLLAPAAPPPPPPRAAEFAEAAGRARGGDVEGVARLARLLREEEPTAEEVLNTFVHLIYIYI